MVFVFDPVERLADVLDGAGDDRGAARARDPLELPRLQLLHVSALLLAFDGEELAEVAGEQVGDPVAADAGAVRLDPPRAPLVELALDCSDDGVLAVGLQRHQAE